jgi:hypothetical protein
MATSAAMAIAGQHTDEWDGNGVSKRMISLTATKMTINKKYNEGGWLGSSSPLRCCSVLRRMDGGLPLTGTNNGGGVASEDEDDEADGDGCGD